MTKASMMPVLKVSGSHRDVGLQIGKACADAVRAAVDFAGSTPKDGRSMSEQLQLAAEYRDVTAQHLPYMVEELDAVAEAAGVDPVALFAASIEEIWEWTDTPQVEAASALASERGRCSDLVAGPPATATGGVLVAHNNDLNAKVEPHLTAIEWHVDDEPKMFTIGIGPWISVGWNESGLTLSGNELAPNDNRLGIPRLLLVREQLRHTTMSDAVDAALHPARASAYNTIFVTSSGEVTNVEGSATTAGVTGLSEKGTLVHTNHYVCDSMLAFEDDPVYAKRSALRFERASELLDEASASPGSVDADVLKSMLSDHENAPDSICRHPASNTTSKTVFWCITDVKSGDVTYGRGNPCESKPQQFHF